MLKKGEAPRLTLELQEELTACLKPVEKWQLINLGKGYFTLKFSCEEDLKKISHFSSYKLSSGVMFLREWKRGFDPYKEQSSVAQVWVRAYHLPAELWHPEVLAAVFREIGNLVKFVGNTMSGNSGHFARALVEVDLSQPIITSVMGGCSDGSLLIDLSYENMPLYCPFCNYVGHDIYNCRKKKAVDMAEKKEEVVQPHSSKQQNEQPKSDKGTSEWVPKGKADRAREGGQKADRVKAGLNTTNRFSAIAEGEEVMGLGPAKEDSDKRDHVQTEDGEAHTCSDSSDSETEGLALRLAKQSMSKALEDEPLHDHLVRQLELETRAKKIRGLLVRSRDKGEANSAVGAKEFEDALVALIEKGEDIADFIIDPGDFVNTRTMSNMANKRWSDQVEEEESGLLGGHQNL